MFYQLCDLEVDRYNADFRPESFYEKTSDEKLPVKSWKFCCCCYLFSIKEVVEQNSGKEQECDERDGWCALGTTDKLRDIISTMIKKVVRAMKPGEL